MKYENFKLVERLCNWIEKCENELRLYQKIKSDRNYYSAILIVNEMGACGEAGRKALTINLDDDVFDRFVDDQTEKLKAEIEKCKAEIENL